MICSSSFLLSDCCRSRPMAASTPSMSAKEVIVRVQCADGVVLCGPLAMHHVLLQKTCSCFVSPLRGPTASLRRLPVP